MISILDPFSENSCLVPFNFSKGEYGEKSLFTIETSAWNTTDYFQLIETVAAFQLFFKMV